jgi:hypothetical protein
MYSIFCCGLAAENQHFSIPFNNTILGVTASCVWAAPNRLVATTNTNLLGVPVTSHDVTTANGLAITGQVIIAPPANPITPTITLTSYGQPSFCSSATVVAKVKSIY